MDIYMYLGIDYSSLTMQTCLSAVRDDPIGKVQFANQGQKFSFEKFVASRPGLEFRY